ncbi:putative C6 transcription factor [Aspergillus ibericus CBS 121593]|uniref:Putative C6 transcription factor n=1 Tax=Aspergillus ibericus CBS 121593 TaxID=1448316 RepID=A0A395GIW6_9EURO|nr:putative C6 transcription factor [Aspergillus ibericus CBS 121593]RAK95146.1 putative C6 transcription factor [Aspergillus ibericus CBS 121593]
MTEPHRKRSRVACTLCQSRKRKCSGDQPCSTCAQFGSDCHYDLQSRRKRDARLFQLQSAPTDPTTSNGVQPPSKEAKMVSPEETAARLSSLDANSGAAFARRLGLKVDPTNAPKMHLFAWNVGARHPLPSSMPPSFTSAAIPVVDLISQDEMRSLVTTFFDKVDPCYGFIDRDHLLRQVSRRWLPSTYESTLPYGPYDAVLCGVAAFGYLFSHRQANPTERHLAETARLILDQSLLSDTIPTADLVTAWVLRVAYLRLTASPHAAWMASCSLMHIIEATGLHLELAPSDDSAINHLPEPCDPETRRRLFGIARHLNVWISFELARSRVVLHGATSLPPTPRVPGTAEIFTLLPMSESLDPNKSTDSPDLESTLRSVLDQIHILPQLILVQCNLMLCIYRRLRALNCIISGDLLDRVLALSRKGLQAAREMVASTSPWHQIANVPFQVVCTLLAIDNRASLVMLGDAMRTLREVAAAYDTEVMREAYSTAYLLILLHQRRKEEDTKALMDVLKVNSGGSSVPRREEEQETSTEPHHSLADYPGFSWLSDLLIDIPSLGNFDMERFMYTDAWPEGV